MILIISTPTDGHAQAVQVELSKLGAASQLLDLSEFPERLALSMSYESGQRSFRFGCKESGFDLDDCGAVWWRRPQNPEISAQVTRPSHRNFALNESAEALSGLWYSLDAFWMNDPARDQVAQRKAYQLRVAQEVGLRVPRTLITNCAPAAAEFVARHGRERTVYKSFSAVESEWRETRLLGERELALLDSVRFSPVIFQEYIEAGVDLRITIVGDEIFPAAIYSQQTAYKVDCRIDIGNARIEPAELPADVAAKLLELMRHLGLVYGAIDMRRTPAGEHVFLEINPAGQWLFIEQHSLQPITSAVARCLRDRDT